MNTITLFSISIILVSTLISNIFLKFFIKYSKRKNLLDKPDDRKLHLTPTPSSGGLVFGFISILLAPFVVESIDISILVICSFGLLIVGFFDDRYDLSAKLKFMAQFIFSIVLLYFIGPVELFSNDYNWLNYTISFLFIIGFTNSYNLIDGVDGIAGLYGILVLSAFTVLLFLTGEIMFALLLIGLIGALLGFLRNNLISAKIFMGDTGTLFLGFFISSTAIIIVQNQSILTGILAHNFNIHILILAILSLPMTDTIRVMSVRIFKGKSPFKADRSHFHHILGKIGLSTLGISTTFSLISIVITSLCLVLLNLNNLVLLLILTSVLIALFNSIIFIRLLKHKKNIKEYKNSIHFLIKSNHLVSDRNISSTINSPS